MMPQISFVKNKAPIEVEVGTNLMKALLAAGTPVASSCNGDGVCCKCIIRIVSGTENLSYENSTEAQLRERHGLKTGVRVSCQTLVIGDITVDTGYW